MAIFGTVGKYGFTAFNRMTLFKDKGREAESGFASSIFTFVTFVPFRQAQRVAFVLRLFPAGKGSSDYSREFIRETLFIIQADGGLYAATYPEFKPRRKGKVGEYMQLIWVP